jgi:Autographiviridae endonuclease VII
VLFGVYILGINPIDSQGEKEMMPRKEVVLTQERLRELLDYDPETGIFTWRKDGKGGRGIRRGQRAGSVDRTKGSYRYIRLDQQDYLAQRLAWFWTHNEWPQFLRFEDGDKGNCAIKNLRDSAFTRAQGSKHDWRTKEGKSAYQKEYRQEKTSEFRARRLKDTFGISLSEYESMHATQKGKCAICGGPETITRNGKVRWLAVDHCHDSEKVRGLLCGRCNPMIGYARDDIGLLENAILYLKDHGAIEPMAMYAMTDINGPHAGGHGAN